MLAAHSVGHAATEFKVTFPNGQGGLSEVCHIGPGGDLIFFTTESINNLPAPTGRVVEANATDLLPQANLAEFRVDRASDGATLMRVSAAGTMLIRGTLHELEAPITPVANSPEFIVQEANGTVLMLIDQQGNLYLRGQVDCGCEHVGTHTDGSLINASSLPNTGEGYVTYVRTSPPPAELPDTEDWGCSKWAIRKTIQVGMDWRDHPVYAGVAPMQVGDISIRNGGNFGHAEHENGLELDVRYLRTDGQVGPLDLGEANVPPPTAYDQARTQALINFWIANGAVSILVDENAGLTGTGITPDPRDNHYNHFHVRLMDPD